MPRCRFPAARDQGARLPRRDARAEQPITASPCVSQRAGARRHEGPARRQRRRGAGALHRGDFRRCPRRLDLSAERQSRSRPRNSPTSSAGWSASRRMPATLLERESPCVLAGDYNVCPTDDDVYDPVGWRNDALCRPETRSRFRTLMNLGLTDAFRVFHAEPHLYTFWDYQAGPLEPRRGAAHRPSAAVAASRRPGDRLHHRQGAARQGQGLRPHADLV